MDIILKRQKFYNLGHKFTIPQDILPCAECNKNARSFVDFYNG